MKVEDPKETRLDWKRMKEEDEKGQERRTYTCLHGSTGVYTQCLWIMIIVDAAG